MYSSQLHGSGFLGGGFTTCGHNNGGRFFIAGFVATPTLFFSQGLSTLATRTFVSDIVPFAHIAFFGVRSRQEPTWRFSCSPLTDHFIRNLGFIKLGSFGITLLVLFHQQAKVDVSVQSHKKKERGEKWQCVSKRRFQQLK